MDESSLLRLLQAAASRDQSAIKLATQELEKLYTVPGFHAALQSIFLAPQDANIAPDVRYLALTILKNNVDKYWRKTADNCLKKDEKELIKSRVLQAPDLDEKSALQNAVVVAKIIRHEYPHEWKDPVRIVVGLLDQELQNANASVGITKYLFILLYIVKELSTARLARSRQSLQIDSPHILSAAQRCFELFFPLWLHGGRENFKFSQTSLLALRIVRRILVVGFDFPNRNEESVEAWLSLGKLLEPLITGCQSSDMTIATNCRMHLNQITKLHVKMVDEQDQSFVQFSNFQYLLDMYGNLLQAFGGKYGMQSLDMQETEIDNDDFDETPWEEQVIMRALLLYRGLVKFMYSPKPSLRFRTPQDKAERQDSLEKLKNGTLSSAGCHALLLLLVRSYFVFTKKDLQLWEEEPDEWEQREEGQGEAWEFSIRLCAEKLFLDLIVHNKTTICPALLDMFRNSIPADASVLTKDSIYAAIGLAGPFIFNEFDYNDFMKNTLVKEVTVAKPEYKILRRRIAIMLAQYAPITMLDRPILYQLFEYLLRTSDPINDRIVRVTAARQLGTVVLVDEESMEAFSTVSEPIIHHLTGLLDEVDLIETRIALLESLSSVVTKMESNVTRVAQLILDALQKAWATAGTEHLLQQRILNVVTNLVTALGSQSQPLQSMFVPLIASSLEPTSPSREYLLEDALDLWQAILIQAPSASHEFDAIITLLIPCFDVAGEHSSAAFMMTDSYLLLSPANTIARSRPLLAALVHVLKSNPKPEIENALVTLLENMVRTAVCLGNDAYQSLVQTFREAGLLELALGLLQEQFSISQEPDGPKKRPARISTLLQTRYYGMFARMALHDFASFEQTIASFFSNYRSWFWRQWFDHIDSIGNTTEKKLSCLALSAMMGSDPQQAYSFLQDFFTMWTSTVVECIEPADGTEESGSMIGPGSADTLLWSNDAETQRFIAETKPSSEEIRRRELYLRDPVHSVDVRDAVRQAMGAFVSTVGSTVSQEEWLSSVDKDIVKDFVRMQIL